ncbi:hypothetical protein F4677DRAFT_446492 [Hypoxylon crocopeplum]|nr:hypothetical protein F4677DRAFT_446492 [Hypoxylon crocopeplum]
MSSYTNIMNLLRLITQPAQGGASSTAPKQPVQDKASAETDKQPEIFWESLADSLKDDLDNNSASLFFRAYGLATRTICPDSYRNVTWSVDDMAQFFNSPGCKRAIKRFQDECVSMAPLQALPPWPLIARGTQALLAHPNLVPFYLELQPADKSRWTYADHVISFILRALSYQFSAENKAANAAIAAAAADNGYDTESYEEDPMLKTWDGSDKWTAAYLLYVKLLWAQESYMREYINNNVDHFGDLYSKATGVGNVHPEATKFFGGAYKDALTRSVGGKTSKDSKDSKKPSEKPSEKPSTKSPEKPSTKPPTKPPTKSSKKSSNPFFPQKLPDFSMVLESFNKIYPSMDNPEETKKEVRRIYKKKLPHLDAASGELAPIFGLGDDLVAKQRAQGLFKHPVLAIAFLEFADKFLRGRWNLPVGDWDVVYELVKVRKDDAAMAQDVCPNQYAWDVNCFYVRFIVRALHGIREPTKNTTQLVYWLRDAELYKASWVLFHALIYLQLEMMRDHKKHAPMKDRISHFLGREQK